MTASVRNLEVRIDDRLKLCLILPQNSDEVKSGQGLATRATEALISFARSQQKFQHVVLYTMQGNGASSAVARKLGFKLDGEITNDIGNVEKRFIKRYDD